MPPLLLMLLQTQPAEPVAIGGYEGFDLASVKAAERICGGAGEDGEIIVCARKAEPEPMRDFSEKPVRATMDLGGGWTGGIEGQQRGIGPGVSVPAAMVTFKLKF